MERYVFFNTNSGEVVHYRDYVGPSEIMKLAFESCILLRTTDFAIKSIYKDKLYCFANDINHPLALTLEFSNEITTEEEGYQFAVSMLQLFMQQFGHILAGKLNKNSFKLYRKSLHMIIDQYLEPIMEKIADDSKAEFLYLSFLKEKEKNSEKEKNAPLSPSSSVNTEISSMDKLPRKHFQSFKNKYPFMTEKHQNINFPRQLFYRLYSKENTITPQIVSVLNASASLANDMLMFEKDELQIMNFCFDRSEIQAIKYYEMLLVISTTTAIPINSQIKQLYNWARLLIG